MLNEESEQQNEFRLPRIAVRIPEPATWRLTATDLSRYQNSKLIIGHEEDPDVKFRKKIDAEYEAKVKEAHVDALVAIVLHRKNSPSIITAMLDAGDARFLKEKDLLRKGVLPTEISHAPDKFLRILRLDEHESHAYFLTTGDGSEKPLSTLDIKAQIDEEIDNKCVNIGLTQKQGPWTGRVEINVPLSHDPTKGSYTPDAVNSRISSADGILKRVGLVEAAKLMIDAANLAADDFDNAVQEVDSVFKDAEAHHG